MSVLVSLIDKIFCRQIKDLEFEYYLLILMSWPNYKEQLSLSKHYWISAWYNKPTVVLYWEMLQMSIYKFIEF